MANSGPLRGFRSNHATGCTPGECSRSKCSRSRRIAWFAGLAAAQGLKWQGGPGVAAERAGIRPDPSRRAASTGPDMIVRN